VHHFSSQSTLHRDILGASQVRIDSPHMGFRCFFSWCTLAAWNVSAARESAWQNSEHLWQFRTIPLLASSFMDMLDGLTTVINKVLLVPVP
jgi:hypothetical protein